MAFLPKEALSLRGGCYCRAIRYEINIPALEDRPLVPGALETPISTSGDLTVNDGVETVKTRVPLIDLDHCGNCRRISGAIIQTWLICPIEWIEWSLLPRPDPSKPEDAAAAEPLKMSTREAIGARTDSSSGNTFVTYHNATERATRTFCSRCGTHLSYFSHKWAATPHPIADITVGSLDDESIKLVRPDRHGWWDFGVGWVKDLLWKGEGGNLIRHMTGGVTTAVDGGKLIPSRSHTTAS